MLAIYTQTWLIRQPEHSERLLLCSHVDTLLTRQGQLTDIYQVESSSCGLHVLPEIMVLSKIAQHSPARKICRNELVGTVPFLPGSA